MTDQLSRTVPAGWYEDPDDAALVRWWNGLAWTDHIEQKPERAAHEQSADGAVAEAANPAASTDEEAGDAGRHGRHAG